MNETVLPLTRWGFGLALLAYLLLAGYQLRRGALPVAAAGRFT